ncbi:MAG: ABC transporter ATP-binding protein [Vulcanimicrobiaceae bacterium]
MTTNPPLLDLRHVTVLRDRRPVLDDLTLTIASGESVAILGRNGAGKSTLLKLLTRECYPVPGDATVCRIMGQERWNVFALRSYLGIVSNDLAASFEPGTPALDVVLGGFFSSLTIEPSIHDVTDAMRATADDALRKLGASDLARRDVRTLSSGEARRVTIARALVHRPSALVFDEPCTSLDLVAQREVRAAMRALAHDGVGVVLVTHDLAEIVPEIDRVVLLHAGRIVADGPKATVLTHEALSAFFEVDVELWESDGTYHAR